MTTLGVFRDDFYPITAALPATQYTFSTANLASTTLLAANIVGAQEPWPLTTSVAVAANPLM